MAPTLTAALLFASVALAAPGERVLLDTSPPLTDGDLLRIEANVQFAYDTWLTERESETLRAGVLDEWLLCDGSGRAQLLEFASSAANLDQGDPDSLPALRAGTVDALRKAGATGRPLGRAVSAIGANLEGVLRRTEPRVTAHDGEAWLEMEEWALSLTVGQGVRFGEALARQLVAAAVAGRPEEVVGSPERWARLRVGLAGDPGAEDRVRAALPGGRAEPAEEDSSLYGDPLGLFALRIPPGYAPRPEEAGGSTFVSGERVLAIGAQAVPSDVAKGDRTVAEVLAQALERGGAYSEPVPRAASRALGASALVERGERVYVLCFLRAPGDTALLSLAAIGPKSESGGLLGDLSLAAGSLSLLAGIWEAWPEWTVSRSLAHPGETAAEAGRREMGRVLAEAAGLLATRVHGMPIGGNRLSFEDALGLVGAPASVSVLECPRRPGV